MTEPMKTAENPRLELAIADAMRENIESTRIMDHVEPLKRVVEEYAAQQVAAERERIKKEMDDLKNQVNSLSIRQNALARLSEMDQYMVKEVEVIPAVVVKYYYAKHQNQAGTEFLKDTARYIESRNPALNEGKTWFQLMADFARKVDFDKTTRF